jgi:type II secretory ATPase GspE/PulE/Tfp pilus assembly ATPase PilB-like protein
VCGECREEYTPDAEALEFLGLKDKVGKVKFYRGKGCGKCKGTGYRTRTQLHEVLTVDKGLRAMIGTGQTDSDAIFKYAASKGHISMAEDARRKVLDGITTAEEVTRVLSW